MLSQEQIVSLAMIAIAATLGCADASVGSAGKNETAVPDGSTPTPSGSDTHRGDAGVRAGTGGNSAAQGGRGGTVASAGTGGSSGTSGGGHASDKDAGAMHSGGAGGSDPAGSGGSAADGGGPTPASQSCMNPAHVLPLNPSNPQDGVTLGGFYVATDTWNAADYDVGQTMYICDYDNWYVVANMDDAKHDGAVKTYPNVHKDFNDAPRISSFSAITSSFAHSAPRVGIYELAYDIWLNGVASNGSTEIMIWTDNYNQVPSGSSLDTVTYDGRSYDVYKSGSYIAFVDTQNTTAGTLNLLSFFNYVIDKGWIPATSTIGQIDYGIELVSTDGRDATFEINGFSLVTH